jgi:long-chain acyl-CoA synthetase
MKAVHTPIIAEVLKRIKAGSSEPAFYWNKNFVSYSEFNIIIEEWDRKLPELGIGEGTVVGFLGEFSPQTCGLMFALINAGSILVPFTADVMVELTSLTTQAGVEFFFEFDKQDNWTVRKEKNSITPELVETFKKRNHPGLIVFTSGSTGKPKGILHDCENVMKKFEKKRRSWRTVQFLLMDHFGGFNTFLATFASLGTAVCIPDRRPDSVLSAIVASQGDLLPTTPTFLNLIITSRIYQKFDLNCVKLISYGTELMPKSTLEQVAKIFPKAELKQTYGLSELGVLRSSSEDRNSTWVKIGGSGFETKVRDNLLWVRSEANMIGYINAPNPFDKEGWMCTGDEVEIKGEYIRFLGRKSEIINVGGKKVFPIEIENVLLEAPNIENAVVFAKIHPILGQAVYAEIAVKEAEDRLQLTERLRTFCNQRLAKYKIPLRFSLIKESEMHNARFKKIRNK